MTGLTKEQGRASDPGRSVMVAASAGTGKTHVLIARLIRLMLTGTSPDELLCLTFTKAAAAEMKTRLYRELGSWTRLSDGDLATRLQTGFALPVDSTVLDRARRLFTETLDLSDDLRIQTFHSFCQSVLGRFPLEAGLLPGFRAAEEAESQAAMLTARDTALVTSLTESAYEDYIRLIADQTTEGSFSDLMNDLRGEQAALEQGIQGYKGAAAYLKALDNALQLDGRSKAQIIEDAITNIPATRADFEGLASALASGGKTDQGNSNLIYQFLKLPEAASPAEGLKVLQGWLLTKDGALRKTLITKPVLKTYPYFELLIERLSDWILDLSDTLKRRQLADQSRALIQIGALQLDAYSRIKSEEGLVDFADMVDRTVSLIGNSGSTQWILFKLDQEINHVLVDEAQDTNEDQWRVIRAIADEFFAGQTAFDPETDKGGDRVRTVFAVGDQKQSIFSFQGAEPEQMARQGGALLDQARFAGQPADTVPMNQSFRSVKAVLDLVDQVFVPESAAASGVLMGIDGDKGGGGLSHQTARTGDGGVVEVWPLEQELDQIEEDPWSLPTEQSTRNKAEDRLARRVAADIYQRVTGQHQSDNRLISQNRAIEPGDIMVLIRRRRGFVDQLTRTLDKLGIPVAGRDRMTLTDELAVMDLMALARSALLPDDDLTLATVLKGPFIGLEEEALFDLAHGRGKDTLFQRLAASTNPVTKTAYDRYRTLIQDAERLDCAPYFTQILERHRGRAALLARLGDDAADPINAFLEQAQHYDRQERGSLLGFLQHMEKAGAELKRDLESTGNAVRIMTVHASKGLQAPLVYLCDTTSLPDTNRDKRLMPWIPAPHQPPLLLWTSGIKGLNLLDDLKKIQDVKAIEEYNRLLYVALTRAEDHLVIAGTEGRRRVPGTCWYASVSAALDTLVGVTETESGVRRYALAQTRDVKPTAKAMKLPKEQLPPPWLYQTVVPERDDARPLRPSASASAPARDFSSAIKDSEMAAQGARDGSAEGSGAGAAGETPPETLPDPLLLGTVMHQAFEWLPNLAPDQRESAANEFFASRLGAAGATRRTAQVLAVFRHPGLADLMSLKGRSEVGLSGHIATPDGKKYIAGRLDRLLVTDTEIVFADFKTGEYVPTSADAVPVETKRQMAVYRAVLQEIYPHKPVKSLLIYTETCTVIALQEHDFDGLITPIS